MGFAEMNAVLARLRDELGIHGVVALIVLSAALAVHLWLVRPQEERLLGLRTVLAARAQATPGADRPLSASAKLAAFHEFFRRDEAPTDWLAKLYGTAQAHGIELRSADYRFVAAEGRLARYQISFPLTGSYPRIRRFLEEALVEIPVLSLDQVAFRRKRPADAQIEAEVCLTLHLPRP